ncbi:MAG: response regulator, partial [bacterium]|nr:response regulator [bacterium]
MNNKKPIKLLTIDDEEQIRRTIRGYFEDCGYDVIESSDGSEGIEKNKKEKP